MMWDLTLLLGDRRQASVSVKWLWTLVRGNMGASRAGARGPRLPKRSVIERMTQQSVQCVPEMMAVLTCFKDKNYDEARCASQMRVLNECVGKTAEQPKTQKSTVFYHLKRLYYMQRRR